jgi:streptogramin lyase
VTQVANGYVPISPMTTLVSGLTAPEGVAGDAEGNVYFADTAAGIKEWSASTHLVTALVPGLTNSHGMAVDGAGNVYFMDTGNNAAKVWSPSTGQVTTLVSSAAGLNDPEGMAVDGAGNVYIADTGNNMIRQWSAATGQLTTLVPSTAGLNRPDDVAVDAAGNVYIADTLNLEIKKWSPSTRQVTTLIPVDARLGDPYGVTVDGAGNLYIADATNGAIAKWTASSQQLTVVASGLRGPHKAEVDGAGNVYIADTGNGVIRKLTAAFLSSSGLTEPSSAGSDVLPRVIPANVTLTGVFSPLSDQPWLTIGAVVDGVVNFSFSSNSTGSPRTAHITLLGQPITVTQGIFPAQTITFGSLPDVPVNQAPFTLAANATSGLTVTFTSGTPSVCTVSGTTVTIVSSGGCSITVSQPGDSAWAPAPSVTTNFTVFFADTGVDGSIYYSAAVNLLAQHGITVGCGSDNYCATQNVTRAQMAIFMVRAIEGGDNFTFSPTPYFTDVQTTDFGFKWIQKMKELGITAGCTVTAYCPNDNVTRAQMAIFLMRIRYGKAGPPDFRTQPYFTDEPATDTTYFKWIQRLKQDGITAGCTVSTYCPNAPVIRGDMAIFIMRGAFNQLLPANTPVISSINPPTLTIGPAGGSFTITGANTHFLQGTTAITPIPGVTFGPVTVNSPTSLTVQMTANAGVAPQPYSLLATTGSEEAVLPNGLNVTLGSAGNLIANASFELPALPANQFQYAPTDPTASWIFDAGSGVSANGSPFTSSNNAAPYGNQVAFIQGTGTISQLVTNFSPGAGYVLTFSAAARFLFAQQSVSIQISDADGSNVADLGIYSFDNGTPAYYTYTTPAFSRFGNTARLTIKGLIPVSPNIDSAVFLDNIQLIPEP